MSKRMQTFYDFLIDYFAYKIKWIRGPQNCVFFSVFKKIAKIWAHGGGKGRKRIFGQGFRLTSARRKWRQNIDFFGILQFFIFHPDAGVLQMGQNDGSPLYNINGFVGFPKINAKKISKFFGGLLERWRSTFFKTYFWLHLGPKKFSGGLAPLILA